MDTPHDPTGIVDGIAPPIDYYPTDEDVELHGKLLELFQKCHDAKTTYDRNAEHYRLYLKGEEQAWRDRSTGEILRLSPRTAKRLFSKNNQLRPAHRALVGKLSRMVPTFKVNPATQDMNEIYGARVAESFLEMFRRKDRLDVKYVQLCETLVWYGTSVIMAKWDPMAGRTRAWCGKCQYTGDEEQIGLDCPVCEQELINAATQHEEQLLQQEMMAEQAGLPTQPSGPNPFGNMPIPKLESIKEGDTIGEVVDPRDVYPEPGIPAGEEAKLRFLFTRQADIPLAEIRRIFPERGQFVGASTGHDGYRDRYITQSGSIIGGYDNPQDLTTLYTYYEQPTESYPKGRVIYFTPEIILDEIENPYHKYGRLPFFFLRWLTNPGEFWGEPPIAQAWHRQKELNSLETVLREYMELLVRIKVLDPLGSQVPVDEFTAVTDQRIKYNPTAGIPQYMIPPEMPQTVFARRTELMEDIRVHYAVSPTEFGMQQQDPNGRAMAIVEAESDQQVGPILKRNFSEWADFHRCLLMITKDRVSPDRKFSFTGEDGFSEVYQFDEMILNPEIDLQLEPDDGLAKNQAVRITQAQDLAGLGLIANPQTGMPDPTKFAQMAKVRIPGIGANAGSQEHAAAMEMIRQIEAGLMPVPQPEDDSVVFAETMLAWLRRKGRKADPMLRERVRMLWSQYMQLAMTQMQPQVGQPNAQPGPMGQAPGAGPGGPDRSAMGGTANNPGHLASDLAAGGGSGVLADAERNLANADQAAENQARIQQSREG